MLPTKIKRVLSKILVQCYVDAFLRHLNRKKLLVIVFHGVCKQDYNPPIWTQVPERIFVDRLKFLKDNYNIVSMDDFISCITGDRPFQQRSVLITFDDGLRNNYTVAFPILERYKIPATIFLTVDYIGTENILWFDELYFLIKEGGQKNIHLEEVDDYFAGVDSGETVSTMYQSIVERMKRISEKDRDRIMHALRGRIKIDFAALAEDFTMLTWDQVLEMKDSGFVDFGVHTANHRILNGLSREELKREIIEPKDKLSEIFREHIYAFCYPNGRPEIDFGEVHEEYLRQAGFICAFSTLTDLNAKDVNPYRIGRIPSGSAMNWDSCFFRLNTSGLIGAIKQSIRKNIWREQT